MRPRRRLIRRPTTSLPFLHLMPNLVTILGLCAGLTSIRFAVQERFEIAAALIVFAAVIDGLDGLLARRLNAASPFGAELDSLADFVNFGVAPGVLVYLLALQPAAALGWVFVLVYAICCCLRLARFNISRDEPLPPGTRAQFVGVPAPAGAGLALLPVFLTLEGVLDARAMPLVWALYLGAVGALMISRLPTPSIKTLRISRESVGFVLIGAAVVVGLMFTRFWLLMILVAAAYCLTLCRSIWLAWQTHRNRTEDGGTP